MTSEISLRGQALPIDSVKENVLAAIQAGIATVVLPACSRKDLDYVPKSLASWLASSGLSEPDIPKTTHAATTERRRHALASRQNR